LSALSILLGFVMYVVLRGGMIDVRDR